MYHARLGRNFTGALVYTAQVPYKSTIAGAAAGYEFLGILAVPRICVGFIQDVLRNPMIYKDLYRIS